MMAEQVGFTLVVITLGFCYLAWKGTD